MTGSESKLSAALFGSSFKWGVSTAAYQIEGAHSVEGKGPSIWDVFSNRKGKIRNNHNGNSTCDFYNLFPADLALMKSLGIPNFRFSLSWPRLLPNGTGSKNQKGIDFYNRLIDHSLSLGIEPWVTLYHWDLPHALEQKGGWTNRDVINWFAEYAELCGRLFGDRVKYWMVLNEPMVFVGAGYLLGVHAPGRRGIHSFLSALHHAAVCQAEGGRVLRNVLPATAEIGTTFSCSYLTPNSATNRDFKAVKRADALLNRLLLEPALGLGYPQKDLPFLSWLEKYHKPGDEALLPFNFDFIGLQNYTREVVKFSWLTPVLQAKLIPASKRQVPHTVMDWEVFPESIYHMLHQFGSYKNAPKIVITENGAAFPDEVVNGFVNDVNREEYLKGYLKQVLRAKQEGVNVAGYFVWSFLDNFEWAKGYLPRFGLVYTNYETQQRIVKRSGNWYAAFLNGLQD